MNDIDMPAVIEQAAAHRKYREGQGPDSADSVMRYRHERFATTEGYAVGSAGSSGEWLTVLGSHFHTIPLFATAQAAWDWHHERFGTEPLAVLAEPVCHKVRRLGQSYFKILDAPAGRPELGEQCAHPRDWRRHNEDGSADCLACGRHGEWGL